MITVTAALLNLVLFLHVKLVPVLVVHSWKKSGWLGRVGDMRQIDSRRAQVMPVLVAGDKC